LPGVGEGTRRPRQARRRRATPRGAEAPHRGGEVLEGTAGTRGRGLTARRRIRPRAVSRVRGVPACPASFAGASAPERPRAPWRAGGGGRGRGWAAAVRGAARGGNGKHKPPPPQRPLPRPADRPVTKGPAYYVDPARGDDGNDGSLKPFKTMQRGLRKLAPGDT